MKITQIPRDYQIWTGQEEIDFSKRVLMSVDYWGELFGSTGAEIRIFEPMLTPPLTPITNLGGIWKIYIDQIVRFQGYLENSYKERVKGGNILTFSLRSVLCAWDLLLTNTTFGVSGADHTVNNMTEYLQYLINQVVSLSGIQFNGTIPSNDVAFSDLYENGILSVVNSSYLTEIQKACQSLGFQIFTNPFSGDVQIINPLEVPGNYFQLLDNEIVKAGFTVDFPSIPATVLVNDDISNIGKSYGHIPSNGISPDETNYNMTGINNLAFATVSGMKETALGGIAHKIYDISRKASQVLTVKKANLEAVYDRRALAEILTWTDSSQRIGEYIIDYFRASIQPNEISTEIRAFVK